MSNEALQQDLTQMREANDALKEQVGGFSRIREGGVTDYVIIRVQSPPATFSFNLPVPRREREREGGREGEGERERERERERQREREKEMKKRRPVARSAAHLSAAIKTSSPNSWGQEERGCGLLGGGYGAVPMIHTL